MFFHSCFCSRLRVYLSDRDMVCTTRSGDRFQPFPAYILLTLILCQRQHTTFKEKGFAYFVSPLGFHLIAPALLKRSLIDVERPHWHAMTATRESILRQNSMLTFLGSLGISKIHFGFHGMPCSGFGFHATAPWPELAASRRSGGARWGKRKRSKKTNQKKRQSK